MMKIGLSARARENEGCGLAAGNGPENNLITLRIRTNYLRRFFRENCSPGQKVSPSDN